MNEEVAGRFLEELHAASAPEEWINIWALDRADGRKYSVWGQVHEIDSLIWRAAQLPETCCVFHGVATRRRRLADGARGKASDCVSVPALWIDIDVLGANHAEGTRLPPSLEAARELLGAFPVPASIEVESGGGLQAYWLFDAPHPAPMADVLDRWGATWQRLADERGWKVDSVWNVDRVMRLPGTVNNKQRFSGGPTPEVAVVRW